MRFKPMRVLSLLALLLLAGCSHNAHTQYPASGTNYGGEVYSQAELDQMLAPIALYPDSLLSQILMAATYPREVAEAARWSTGNPGLSGAAAVEAAKYMDWDPSVKALVAFPQVLDQMARDLAWTQALGDAYLVQEPDVADAIQRLRDHAYRAGQLDRMEHVRVIRDRNYYIIEPASPRVVYVPYYHPLSVYGDWWWPNYPPHYWAAPIGYHSGLTFYWGSGIYIAPTFFYSRFHWHNRHIVIVDRHHYRPYYSRGGGYDRYRDARRWQHDNKHRRGVAYHQGYRGDRHDFRSGRDGRFQDGGSWERNRDQRDSWQRDRSTRDNAGDGRNRDFDRDRRPGQWDGNRDYRGDRQPRQGVERPRDTVNTAPRGQESRDNTRGSRFEPAAGGNRSPGQWDRPERQRQFGGEDQRARPQAPQRQREMAPDSRVSTPGGFRDRQQSTDSLRQEQYQRGERSGASRADPQPSPAAREIPAQMVQPMPEQPLQHQRQERTWERGASAPEQRDRPSESRPSRSEPELGASQLRQAPLRDFNPQSSHPRVSRDSEPRHSSAGPRGDVRGQHSGGERPTAGGRGQGWGDRQRQ